MAVGWMPVSGPGGSSHKAASAALNPVVLPKFGH